MKIRVLIILFCFASASSSYGVLGGNLTCLKYSKRYYYFLKLHNKVNSLLLKSRTLLDKVPIQKQSLKKKLTFLQKRLEFEEIRLNKKLKQSEIKLVKMKCPDSRNLSKLDI